MKLIKPRVLLLFFVVLLFEGCSNSSSRPTSLPTVQPSPNYLSDPTKEILLTYGRYDKPFTRLGLVEYQLKTPPTPDDTSYEYLDQAIESLKQAALRRFGDKLDAIVNVEIVESTEGSIGEQYNMIHAKGLAISFSPGTRPTIKPRPKIKHKVKPPSKAITSKPKPSTEKKPPEKPQPEEEIEITPSELLK